jgi:hypothetical protein
MSPAPLLCGDTAWGFVNSAADANDIAVEGVDRQPEPEDREPGAEAQAELQRRPGHEPFQLRFPRVEAGRDRQELAEDGEEQELEAQDDRRRLKFRISRRIINNGIKNTTKLAYYNNFAISKKKIIKMLMVTSS